MSLKSANGWVIFVIGLHSETSEDDLYDLFGNFSNIRLFHSNGILQDYCLIEFQEKKDALNAVTTVNNCEFMEKTIHCDFAFTTTHALQ